jgi:hypothetical protein
MSIVDASKKALRDASLMLGGGERRSGDQRADAPTRLIFGTVVRTAPIEEGGELAVLNWNDKEVEKRIPIVPRDPEIEHDPNPRGSTRGCRGIRYHDDRIIASSYHTLECYDEHLQAVGALSDGLMVGLHEIALTEDETVWVTSTAIDAVVEYDLDERERIRSYWPREMPALQDEFGLEPLSIDKEADNRLSFLAPSSRATESHLHLNAVEKHDGEVYALSNAHGAILNLSRERVAMKHERLQGGHNLLIRADGTAIVNDTYGEAVRFYDLEEKRLVQTIDLTTYRWVRDLIRWKIPAYWGKELARKVGVIKHSIAKPLFVRGLVLDGAHLFVGVSPAAILQVNWQTGELVDAFQYASDVHVCVHGLEVMG